ncbi:hypothetical protein AB0901_09250 [Streptomyces roseifaciens]
MQVRTQFLAGVDDAFAAARAESHVTRAAITAPFSRLVVLAPQLADVAQAAYALRGAPGSQTSSAPAGKLRSPPPPTTSLPPPAGCWPPGNRPPAAAAGPGCGTSAKEPVRDALRRAGFGLNR